MLRVASIDLPPDDSSTEKLIDVKPYIARFGCVKTRQWLKG
jgi:hypothetical protein